MQAPVPATDQDVDALLSAVGQATDTLLADKAAAARHMDECNDACEHLLKQRAAAGLCGDQPRIHTTDELLADARHTLSTNMWEHYDTTARQFAAWWADAAAIAVQATANGTTPAAARLVAADPSQALSGDEVAHLPGVTDHDRNLVRLTHWMSTAGAPDIVGDLPAHTRDLSDRLGVEVHAGEDGELVVRDSPFSEARRRRIWGTLWFDHQLPLLPATSDLTDVLSALGVAASVVQEVRAAGDAVESAIVRVVRLAEIIQQQAVHMRAGTIDPALDDEMEACQEAQYQMTDLLADYARVLTIAVPTIRQARDTST